MKRIDNDKDLTDELKESIVAGAKKYLEQN